MKCRFSCVMCSLLYKANDLAAPFILFALLQGVYLEYCSHTQTVVIACMCTKGVATSQKPVLRDIKFLNQEFDIQYMLSK